MGAIKDSSRNKFHFNMTIYIRVQEISSRANNDGFGYFNSGGFGKVTK